MINKDSPHPNIVFFSSIINGLCKEGNVTYAQDIFNLVVEIGESPDVTTFTSLIDGYCLVGKMEKASRVFDCVDTRFWHGQKLI